MVFSWAPMALEMTCRAIGLFNSRTPRRKASLAGIGYLSHRHNNFAYRNGIVVAALEVYHAASDSRRHFFEELAEDGRINFRLMGRDGLDDCLVGERSERRVRMDQFHSGVGRRRNLTPPGWCHYYLRR